MLHLRQYRVAFASMGSLVQNGEEATTIPLCRNAHKTLVSPTGAWGSQTQLHPGGERKTRAALRGGVAVKRLSIPKQSCLRAKAT